jgi:hypothetical protein
MIRLSKADRDGAQLLDSNASPVSLVANSTNQLSSSMLVPSFGPGGVTLTCSGVQGVSFRVQRALTLAGPWTTIATVVVDESGTGTCLIPPRPRATHSIAQLVRDDAVNNT